MSSGISRHRNKKELWIGMVEVRSRDHHNEVLGTQKERQHRDMGVQSSRIQTKG
jgi:hypothetical protein